MSALIGFNDDDEHVLCERCSKDQLCCEKFWMRCDACDEDGYVDGDWDEDAYEGEAVCDACEGARGWWFCDCDENGKHAARTARVKP